MTVALEEKVTPKLNLRWDIIENDDITLFLRSGVGKGYRVPNLKERYYIFDHSHIGYIIVGNPETDAESSNSYQLGLTLSDKDSFNISLNFFQNDLDDLIEAIYSSREGGITIYEYGNIDSAQTKGIELNASYRYENFRIQGGYVYMEATNETTGNRLKDRPENQIKTTLDYNFDFGLKASLITRWQDEEVDEDRETPVESPSWSRYDLKLNQMITDEFSIYGGIDNITDTQRDFFDGYDNRPIKGRMIYLGFKYQL